MFKIGVVCAVLVIAVVLTLGGCPGRTSESVSSMVTSAPSVEATANLPHGAGGSRHAEKHPADWSMTTYNDPEYGLSFRYPRDYALEDGEVDEHSFFLRRQEDLEPDTKLLATVLIPEDGYPNTNFEHGSLQVLVHEGLDPDGCRELVDPENGAFGEKRVRVINTDNGPFWWSEEKSSADGTQIVEREYAAFLGGRCYEFYAVVALGELEGQDSAARPADPEKILRQLEKIVVSVRVSAAPVRVGCQFATPGLVSSSVKA
jgi:hypothetical protein